MSLTPVQDLISEKNIVVFSPHFDDFLFMLGGYVTELQKEGLLPSKKFHLLLIFSRSNYLAGTGPGNFDSSLDRIKLATGKRLLEDMNCNDELLGRFNYTYELLGENECFTRGKSFADSEMEFPHGMFDDFDEQDHQIFQRMKDRIGKWSLEEDTALVFPLAIKEHIDHFIVREAAVAAADLTGEKRKATYYFQEDKPYGGIADDKEWDRIHQFIKKHDLSPETYAVDPENVIKLAFRHYISQVEEVYKIGIRNRAQMLKAEMDADVFCDRIYKW